MVFGAPFATSTIQIGPKVMPNLNTSTAPIGNLVVTGDPAHCGPPAI